MSGRYMVPTGARRCCQAASLTLHPRFRAQAMPAFAWATTRMRGSEVASDARSPRFRLTSPRRGLTLRNAS